MFTYEALLASRLAEKEKPETPILIVEDDRGLRMIFEWMIRDINPELKFHWCSSYQEASEAIRKNRYQLVISDFMLKGPGDGLDVWERSAEFLPQAKFVMMSSLQLDKFCRFTLPGASEPEVFSKPLDVERMQSIIRNATQP